MPKISCIIPTMKGREALLNKLLSTIPDEYEKIIVADEDLLLAAKRNKGARQATGDYLFFVDDDNYLEEFALNEMLRNFHSNIGVMGMTACYADRKRIIADGGSSRNFLTGFTKNWRTNQKIYDPIPEAAKGKIDEVANAFMIRKSVFEDVGGFDEENFPIELDEADICKRIKDMGYAVVMNPRAICYHASYNYSHIPDFRRQFCASYHGRNRILFQRKHNSTLRYWLYLIVFMPVFVVFYTASLLWRRKPAMVWHFLRGLWDGLRGRRENTYQQKIV